SRGTSRMRVSPVVLAPYVFPVFSLFFTDTPTTVIYTLSLHDALPILAGAPGAPPPLPHPRAADRRRAVRHRLGDARGRTTALPEDRKSTRLNSSHVSISYAVFCLKKKRKKTQITSRIDNAVECARSEP